MGSIADIILSFMVGFVVIMIGVFLMLIPVIDVIVLPLLLTFVTFALGNTTLDIIDFFFYNDDEE